MNATSPHHSVTPPTIHHERATNWHVWFSRHSPQQRRLVTGLLGGLLLVGLLIWRDFGMSYDMEQSRNIGITNLRYVATKLFPSFLELPSQKPIFDQFQTPLAEFPDRDYGVAYELPVTLGERLLQLDTPRSIYLFRHLCTFLVCWVGVLALYGLGKRRYGGDWRTGLAAAALLVFSPRLFGEFFYNDKDAVFMSLNAVAIYTAVCFLEQPTWRRALLHALACAVAIDVRLMAVLVPVATLALLAWRLAWSDYQPVPRLHVVGVAGVFVTSVAVLVVLLWPYLWANPLNNFVTAFDHMKRFRWEGLLLYRGEMVSSVALPWHYSFKWIGITTPLLQLGLLGLGLGLVLWQLVSRGWRLYRAGSREWQDLLFLGLGTGPLLAVLYFDSVLYDGWRQLYFVYPPLLLLALRGMTAVVGWLHHQPRWQQSIGVAVLALGLLTSAGQMVWTHPFESLYFNTLAGPNFEQRYEQDYWGITYGAALRWVDKNGPSNGVIRVTTDMAMWSPLHSNYFTLPADIQRHIQLTDNPAEANYFLANYRWHPYGYDFPYQSAHDIEVDGRRVITIFLLH